GAARRASEKPGCERHHICFLREQVTCSQCGVIRCRVTVRAARYSIATVAVCPVDADQFDFNLEQVTWHQSSRRQRDIWVCRCNGVRYRPCAGTAELVPKGQRECSCTNRSRI